MFSHWESGWGLDFVHLLEGTRGPLGDVLAQVLHFCGESLFFMLVLSIIYWAIDRKLGSHLIIALAASFALGTLLKTQFHAPRPVDVDPILISPLWVQEGYGFPSNHVLLAVAIWGLLAIQLRNRWLHAAFVFYVLAQMWGRVYSGVHFLHDVIGGLLFGIIALWLFLVAKEWLALRWKLWSGRTQLALIISSSLLSFIVLAPNEEASAVVGLWLGCGLGIFLSEQWPESDTAGSFRQRLIRVCLGLILLLSFFYLSRSLFDTISQDDSPFASILRLMRYALTTILGLALLPRCFVWLNLAQSAGDDRATIR
ncbi:MAG: phosphatase PAP2 family protein [Chloroflexi bacterium]|nr:phosphatase PAP2 family protein [Chloroflexota bacterium]